MTALVKEHGSQSMSCSTNFSMTLQPEILSRETLDFLKQMIVLNLFNSVFNE